MSGKKVVHSRKRKTKILVPVLAEYIIQPNHVTNARYHYSLIQERIFTAIMYFLQRPIEEILRQRIPKQLDIFEESKASSSLIKITIPLKEITVAGNYHSILPAAKKMVETSIIFPVKKENGDTNTVVAALVTKVEIPPNRRNAQLELSLSREVAEILVDIQKKQEIPIEYTRYMYQIAQGASSKYTSLLYKKICSWRKKGGFTILVENIYKDLCVQDVYLNKDGTINYKNFKSRVIEKAKQELFQKSDIWFEYSENRQDGRVHSLTFKIITPELEKSIEDAKNSLLYFLRSSFKMSNAEMARLNPIFQADNFDYYAVKDKVIYVLQTVEKDKAILFPKAYMITSLLKEFAPDSDIPEA